MKRLNTPQLIVEKAIYFLFLLCTILPLSAYSVWGQVERGSKGSLIKVTKVNYVYDGDTFYADLNCNFDVFCKKIPIRIARIDTPEIRGDCQKEKDKAKEAKNYLNNLLNNAQTIEIKNVERGKYFRIVADVYIDGELYADKIIHRGLATPYGDAYGWKKKNWCF
ncbi:MAG: thermonuclease family protein [Flavobacteriaceae bacterium]|nr:thermonuclease family protein [Flavobacteriaceae bacterium]